MSNQKLCACDWSRQSRIYVDINLVDTVKQPFAAIVNDLSDVTHDGLWLTPFRGIPRGPRLSRFDVIYLDENCRVLESANNFTQAEFVPICKEADSALILPAHAIASSHIQKGDQLRICRGSKKLAGFDDETLPADGDGALQCLQKRTHPVQQIQERIQEQAAITAESAAHGEPEERPSLMMRLLRWIFPPPAPSDRRRGERLPAQGLIAYYWTGGAPQAYQVGNVSNSGLYLLSEERWLPGTRIVMTLQKEDGEANSDDITRVESEVVRWGEDGVGCAFVESGFVDLNNGEVVENQKFDREAFEHFLQRVQRSDSAGRPNVIQ